MVLLLLPIYYYSYQQARDIIRPGYAKKMRLGEWVLTLWLWSTTLTSLLAFNYFPVPLMLGVVVMMCLYGVDQWKYKRRYYR